MSSETHDKGPNPFFVKEELNLEKLAFGRDLNLMDLLAARAVRFVGQLMKHRERYLRAWIAATGLHPTECELVEEVWPADFNGVIRTRIYCRKSSVGRR